MVGFFFFLLPAHVGSELGRSLGLSSTAAEFIGARSWCKTWGEWNPLGPPVLSRDPDRKQSVLKTGQAAAEQPLCSRCNKNNIKARRKNKNKVHRTREALQSREKEALQTIWFLWSG